MKEGCFLDADKNSIVTTIKITSTFRVKPVFEPKVKLCDYRQMIQIGSRACTCTQSSDHRCRKQQKTIRCYRWLGEEAVKGQILSMPGILF